MISKKFFELLKKTIKNFALVLALAELVVSSLAAGALPEVIKSIMAKTDDCFQCGMIEGFGFINVKVPIKPLLGHKQVKMKIPFTKINFEEK